MNRIIGINLGSMNCCVCACKDNKMIIIPNSEGYNVTPSVMSYNKDNELLIGVQAKRQSLINIENTSSLLENYLNDNQSDINQTLLKRLIENSSQYLSDQINEVVLALPYIDRNDYSKLCEPLGIKVKQTISESEAIALAYQQDHNDEIIMIVNLDEAFYHVSIAEIEKDGVEILSEQSIDLKGYDFTQCISDYLVENFLEVHNIDLSHDYIALKRIYDSANKAKKELSSSLSSRILIPYIQTNKFGPINLDVTLMRSKFNHICRHLISKLQIPIFNALNEARLLPGEIDRILLVGGSTRIPIIQDKIKEIVGIMPSSILNNNESIALGAAILANDLAFIKKYKDKNPK